METKPKKALRGLFTRTEAKPEIETQLTGCDVTSEPSQKQQPMQNKPIEADTAVLNHRVAPAAPIAIQEDKTEKTVESIASSPKTEDVSVSSKSISQELRVENTSQAKSQSKPLSQQVLNPKNQSLETRETWTEQTYLELIRNIDRAQTEAFLMKGKLLSEVKEKFFKESKTGWKCFCDTDLQMNYTTANQYIRVAEEFEAIASDRPEFGFEHFKALLPLSPEQRSEVLQKQEAVSVKKLRQLAFEISQGETAASLQILSKSTESTDAKNLVKSLELLKKQLFSLNAMQTLPQQTKWQVAAACSNLSEELHRLALQLNRNQAQASDANNRTGATFLEAT